MFLSTPNPRSQTSLVFRRVMCFRFIHLLYRTNPRFRSFNCCRCERLRKNSWLHSTPKIKLPTQHRQCVPRDFIPVHTPPTNPQALSRKEFDDNWDEVDDNWDEVSSSRDVVNWISTTGYLARLPTNLHIVKLILQFMCVKRQCSGTPHPHSELTKVWFVFMVLTFEVLCCSWRCSWSFLVVPLSWVYLFIFLYISFPAHCECSCLIFINFPIHVVY